MDIKSIRKKLHLTQEEFSKICGISRVSLSNLENGKNKNPGIETLNKIYKSIYNYIFFSEDVNYNTQIEKFGIIKKME